MKTLEEIKEVIIQHKEDLKRNFKVKEIGIFGSFVRGEQKKGSDVDILVEFEEPIGFFQFLDLEEYLTKLIGIKVDLVSKGALKPIIGEKILKEVIYLQEKDWFFS
jgi:predicted nucleotidyltransferase